MTALYESFHLPRLRGGSFCLPFEVSLALGAINGNGKAKKLCFYHTKLKILLALEQEKKEERKKKKKKMEVSEGRWIRLYGWDWVGKRS